MQLAKIAIAISGMVSVALAADCTAKNTQYYSAYAVDMMWSVRQWLCPNAWGQSITAGPAGNWCAADGSGYTYTGSWTIAGM
jgi:hypothetical protein